MLIPLAQYTGMADLEARWRDEFMMSEPGSSLARNAEFRLGELQKQRLRFYEYGAQIEAYYNVLPKQSERNLILQKAADSYRASGNTTAELQVLAKAFGVNELDEGHIGRYYRLLLDTTPQQLVTIAGGQRGSSIRNLATAAAVGSGKADLALQAIAARGRGLTPVWTRAYSGLTGLYYADPSPAVNTAYREALGSPTIGDRIGKPVDRKQQLAGTVWFYYGSRYGEYLSVLKQGNPEDFLPATLEGTPVRSDAYFSLADYYQDTGQLDWALADYAHAVELNSKSGEAHDRMAVILWQQGKQDDAVKEWSAALKAFRAQEDSRKVPLTFWSGLQQTLEEIGKRKLLPQVLTEADRVVRTYVLRNGNYSAKPILLGVMAAAGEPEKGAGWLVDLARSAPAPDDFLSELVNAEWFPDAQKGAIYQKLLDEAQDKANKTFGQEHNLALEALQNWQSRRLDYLLDHHRTVEAQAAFDKLPAEDRELRNESFLSIRVRLAAQSHKFDELIQQLQADPEKSPSLQSLQNVATSLESAGNKAESRLLLDYVYTQKIAQREFVPANFLELAEIRLLSGDLAQALALLRRMNLVAGEPFENLIASGDLLVKNGHATEAGEFYSARVKAVPWDADARLKLARAKAAADDRTALLVSVATSADALYATRTAAAEALATAKNLPASLGSGELDWLAKGGPESAAAAPGFFRARLRAADKATQPENKIKLLLDAIATRPEENAARLTLFKASFAAGRYALAFSAVSPMIGPGIFSQWSHHVSPAANPVSPEEENYHYPFWNEFLSGQNLADADRAALAAQFAQAAEKLRQLQNAGALWTVASKLASADTDRASAQRALSQLQARIDLEERDAARRPAISEHLEQKDVVRPRLLGGTSPPGATHAAGGSGR